MAKPTRSRTKRNQRRSNVNVVLVVLVILLAIALVFSLFYGDALRSLLGLSPSSPDPAPSEEKTDSTLGYRSTLNLPVELSGTGMLEIHFIDVGQGDGILLRLPDKDVLIDSGSGTSANKATIEKHLSYLESLGLGAIEVMIATHPDSDHINMLDDVLDAFAVDNIYFNEPTKDTATLKTFVEKAEAEKGADGAKANIVRFDGDGDVYRLGNDAYTLDVYAPGYSRFEDVNSSSPIIHLSYCGFDAYFVGDAHTDTEEWFLENYSAVDCDVLKVGHHGSATSSGEAWLNAVAPEYAVISVGETNGNYQHPYYLTMNHFFNRGIVTYRTNRHGNIVLHVDDRGEFAFEVQNVVPVENNKNLINDRMMVPAA